MGIYENLYEVLHFCAKYLALFIEFAGLALIAYTVIRFIIHCFSEHKFKLAAMEEDCSLNHGLSVALEIMLAAEILKTMTFASMENLIEIVILVLIRVFMGYIMHWENSNKRH